MDQPDNPAQQHSANSPNPDLTSADGASGVPLDAPPETRSPIRPAHPTDTPPRPSLIPARPDTGSLREKKAKSGPLPDKPLSPQEALEELRQKMAQAAKEFAQGQLNRAQFYAIYARYNEQRTIVERLVARDPNSQAWQQVTQAGHTAFLRQHFEARILSLAIYDLGKTAPIVQYGTYTPRPDDLHPILRALPGLLQQRGSLGPARKQVTNGHWLALVPGQYTVSVVLFSLEPAAQQMIQIADLHRDFERANVHTLTSGDRARERLVFPQRALFEGQEIY